MHQVGFIYKIIQGCSVNNTQKMSRIIEFGVPGTGCLQMHVLELFGSCVTDSACNQQVNFLRTVREMTREIFRSENCN